MKYIYIFFALFIFSACEQTLDDAVIPYVEQLVVFSVIEPGEHDLQLQISKTLPVLGVQEPEKAIITNVTGYITDGTNSWDVEYLQDADYVVKGFEGVVGQTYELFLEWNGKKVHSKTTIPSSDVISAFNYYFNYRVDDWAWNNEGRYYLMGHFEGSSEYVYQIYYEGEYYSYYSDYFLLPKNKGVAEVESFWEDWSSLKKQKYHYKIVISDIAFYDYLEEESGNNDDFDFFSIGGINVDWNVKGDGIGMFVGRNFWRDTVRLGDLEVVE